MLLVICSFAPRAVHVHGACGNQRKPAKINYQKWPEEPVLEPISDHKNVQMLLAISSFVLRAVHVHRACPEPWFWYAIFRRLSYNRCFCWPKRLITTSIWTFCGQKWAPRRAPLAAFGHLFPLVCAGFRKPRACERLLVQNCKSPVASGRFVVRNGLQDGLLWPLRELKLHKLR